MEPDVAPDITRGTLEGQIAPGPVTFLRLQGDLDGDLAAYLAQGRILDIDPASFGCISVVAIPNFARFYRHVLIAKGFPHHAAVAFDHCGNALFDAMDMMGVDGIDTPLPDSVPYDRENPWAK
jgi:L-fucose isomerase-like protein